MGDGEGGGGGGGGEGGGVGKGVREGRRENSYSEVTNEKEEVMNKCVEDRTCM